MPVTRHTRPAVPVAARAWRYVAAMLCALVGAGAQTPPGGTPAPDRPPAPAPTAIAVTVLDAAGKPAAGVPLVLGQLSRIGDEADFRLLDRAARPVTDAQGRATLAVPAGTPWPLLHVQALIVTEPPLRESLTAQPPSVTLRLPPCGRVRVLVYDDRERPRSGVTGVTLRQAGNRRFFDHVDVSGALQPEGALFEHVALGLQLEARASLAGVTGAMVVRGAGPTRAGELVVLDLRSQAGARVRCRLLDLGGQPLRSRSFGLLHRNGQSCQLTSAATDADGGFAWQIPDGANAAADASLLVILGGADQAPAGSVSLPLAPAWHGERDLGDVRLQPEVAVRRGRLVDEQGRPIAGARVTAPLVAMLGFVGSGDHTRGEWAHDVRTDAEGLFALRELEPKGASVPITVHGDWLVPPDTVLPPGDERTTVTARRSGRIRLRLPGLPAGVQVPDVVLQQPAEIARRGPGFFGGPRPVLRTGEDGALEFTGLQPGRYELTIGGAFGQPRLRLGDLDVPAGGECADPRLVAKEWPASLQFVRVRVLAVDGSPMAATVQVVEAHANGFSSHGFQCAATAPLQVVVAAGCKLVVAEPAFAVAVADAGPAVELRLSPRPTVAFALRDGKRLPAGVRLRVTADALRGLGTPGAETTVTATADPVLRPEQAGASTVSLGVPQGDGTFADLWTGAVVIADAATPQRQELAVPDDVLASIRQALAPKGR